MSTVGPAPTGPPARIVSLVPSITETVAHFGLLASLVGRTRHCTEPAGRVEAIETVGGTKNPDCGRIVQLAPDLVIVNKEENRLEDYRVLVEAGLRVHVTHPRSVAEAISMIDELGIVLDVQAQARRLTADCRRVLAAGGAVPQARPRVFCPIWRHPWMTFTDTTYIGDVLRSAGFDNVFGAEPGSDFFEVELEEVRARAPALVLLPDEPFVFEPAHGRELQSAGIDAPFLCLDGRDLSWYGPRIAMALPRLCAYRADHSRP